MARTRDIGPEKNFIHPVEDRWGYELERGKNAV